MKKLTDFLIMETRNREKNQKKSVELSKVAKAYNVINEMLEGIYQDFGKIDELMGGIMKEASQSMIIEDDDWFDKVTIKRNIKELEKRGKDFIGTFKDVKTNSLRLQALHEEIGFILNRYFELGE